MTTLYALQPFLWTQNPCTQALTIYSISPCGSRLPSACSARPQEDPAYYWDNPTLQRILMPNRTDSVTWTTLPTWLSFAETQGYTIVSDICSLTPFSTIYIRG